MNKPVYIHPRNQGFSLIELMIGVTLGLLIMTALVSLFVNTSQSIREMAKVNSQIENGRFAMQLLQNELMHAGFWGEYLPEFDNLTASMAVAPVGVPTSVPAPCAAYSTWNSDYKNNLITLPVQAYDDVPTGCSTVITDKQANTDVLVIRHASTCPLVWSTATASWVPDPDSPNCEADTAGKLYFQTTTCQNDFATDTAQGATTNSITLSAAASATDDYFNGRVIRIKSGPGAGQLRTITDYDGATRMATVSPDWLTSPDSTSTYTFSGFGYLLGTNNFNWKKNGCALNADKRKFISHIYYIRDWATEDSPKDGIPTLMRSEFDLSGGTLQFKNPEPLINGIQGFRVELGLDNKSETGEVVDYTSAVQWEDEDNLVTLKNRGDGVPEEYKRCTTAAPCTTGDLANVVAAKLYVLARAESQTPGYTDNKTYCLGTRDVSGNCPVAVTMGPFSDGFKRHVYSTTIRLTNVSGRRETP